MFFVYKNQNNNEVLDILEKRKNIVIYKNEHTNRYYVEHILYCNNLLL